MKSCSPNVGSIIDWNELGMVYYNMLLFVRKLRMECIKTCVRICEKVTSTGLLQSSIVHRLIMPIYKIKNHQT